MANESTQDLAKLEYEFATNPNSEAFIPLAQAYLKMGRFVEAMVVCKKGIKAHPELPTGRLIMARIYADQAKHQKAIEELNNLLKLSPQNVDAFRLLGKLHLKLGREAEGIDYLKKTLEADPGDAEAKEELLKRGIDYLPASAAPPPEPEPAVVSSPPAQPDAPTMRNIAPVPEAVARAQAGQPRQPGGATERPTQKVPVARRPAPPPQPAPPPRPQKRIADMYQEMEAKEAAKNPSRKGFKYTISLAAALLVVLAVYLIYTWQAGLKQEEINKNLEAGRIAFNKDTFAGYKKALDHYRAIYKLEKEQPEALSRAPFAIAVLMGEHGENRDLTKEAEKYVREAMALEDRKPTFLVAQAMMALYGGGSQADAIKLLEKGIRETPEASTLRTALGLILLSKGELGQAKDHLLEGAKSGDTRALMGLGDWALRRSLYREAAQFYNRVQQTDREHTGSLLKLGLMAVLRGNDLASTQMTDQVLKRFKDELAAAASEREKSLAEMLTAVVKARIPATRAEGHKQFAEMLKKDAANAQLHFVVAREYRRQGKLAEAKDTIQKALRTDSSRPDFVLEEASIFLALKDWESARARALRVQAMDAESGQSALIVGQAYLGEKNGDKAKEYFEKARDFEDTEAISHWHLAMMHLTGPRPDADLAQAEFELAVSSLGAIGERRMAAEAATELAKIYKNKNRAREFVGILDKAINIDPSFAPPYALYLMAIDTSNDDGKAAAVEKATKYLELAPGGEYAEVCKTALKQFSSK